MPLPANRAEWPSIVEPEVLGWTADPGEGWTLLSSAQEVRLGAAEWSVGFRHGLMPPSENDPRLYLIDTDCYAEGTLSADAGGVVARATVFNDVANRFFFSAITEAGLQRFDPRPKEA